jgi:hypothetical protein
VGGCGVTLVGAGAGKRRVDEIFAEVEEVGIDEMFAGAGKRRVDEIFARAEKREADEIFAGIKEGWMKFLLELKLEREKWMKFLLELEREGWMRQELERKE